MLSGSHSADSISTSVVVSSQPECSPPMMPAMRLDAVLVGDHDMLVVERVGAAVERQHLLAVPGAADGEIALDLGGVEDVQRPAAVEGHVVGDVDERVDRAQADRRAGAAASSPATGRS